MKKIHLMTAAIAVVAVAVVSQLRTVEAFKPVRPDLSANLRFMAGKLSRRLRRLVNNWVAAAIAYREHQATLSALGKLSDAELKDFGVYRGSLGSPFHRYRDVKFSARRREWLR